MNTPLDPASSTAKTEVSAPPSLSQIEQNVFRRCEHLKTAIKDQPDNAALLCAFDDLVTKLDKGFFMDPVVLSLPEYADILEENFDFSGFDLTSGLRTTPLVDLEDSDSSASPSGLIVESASEIDSDVDFDSDLESYDPTPMLAATDDPHLDALLEALFECLVGDKDQSECHQVSIEFSREAMKCLMTQGMLGFMGKYILPGLDRKKTLDLLAALGFNLPLEVCSSPDITDQHLEIALQVGMKYSLSHRRRLPSPRTLDEICEAIKKAKNILVVTGAGISTSLGIPDFRSDDGLYAQLAHLGLTDPQEVFDIRTFRQDPRIFYSVAKKILPESGLHVGTPTHRFIKLLSDHNKLLRNYTQNIDNLEQFTGVPAEKVVQCHGSFGSAHCITCDYQVPDGEVLFPDIKQGLVPKCPECAARKTSHKRRHHNPSKPNFEGSDSEEEDEEPCYGVMKPDITFFGEALPHRFDELLLDEGDAFKCDLLLCFGTSLRVSPVSSIVKVVDRSAPQIYISRTRAKHCTFECEFLGNCDDAVELLCQKLGWKLDHPMAKRPQDMPENLFPGGIIDYDDGKFVFENDVEDVTKESKEPKEPKEAAEATGTVEATLATQATEPEEPQHNH